MEVTGPNQGTCSLVLHFRDGSIDDETAVFSQKGQVHLISGHQKGTTILKPIDILVEGSGDVISYFLGDEGKEKVNKNTSTYLRMFRTD